MKYLLIISILSFSALAQNTTVEQNEIYLQNRETNSKRVSDGVASIVAPTVGFALGTYHFDTGEAVILESIVGGALGVTVVYGLYEVIAGKMEASKFINEEQKNEIVKYYKHLKTINSKGSVLDPKHAAIINRVDCDNCSDEQKKFLFLEILKLSEKIDFDWDVDEIKGIIFEQLGSNDSEINIQLTYELVVLKEVVNKLED